MKNIKMKIIIQFIIISLLLNSILYLFLTIDGVTYLYDFGFNLNSEQLNFDENFLEYGMISKELKSNNVFLIGETHGLAVNNDIYFDMLKYLSKNASVKYILIEAGYCVGELLNIYLKTGDELFLSEILDSYNYEYFNSVENLSLYKNIYNYNQTLTYDKKLKFVGIDMENQKSMADKYINYLINNVKGKVIPKIITNDFMESQNDKTMYYTNIYNSILENEPSYKELFVENFFTFKLSVKNYLATEHERTMATNFTELYEYYSNYIGKYFGQFDLSHINNFRFYLAYDSYSDCFLEIVNKIYPKLRNKFFVMDIFYQNCDSLYSPVQVPFSIGNNQNKELYTNVKIVNYKKLKLFHKYYMLIEKLKYDSDLINSISNYYFIVTNSPSINNRK